MRKENFIHTTKKYVIAILIAILLSVVMELAVLISLPPKYKYNFSSDAIDFPFELEIVPVSYEVNGSAYSPLGNDPQLHLSGFSCDLYAIQIEFGENLQDDTLVQIFYLGEDNTLSEQNSVKQTINRGEQSVIIKLPKNHYNYLRIDINGDFVLKKLTYTDQPLEREKLPEHIYGKQLISIAVVMIGIAVLVVKTEYITGIWSVSSKFWDKIRQPSSVLFILFIGSIACLSMILERVIFGGVYGRGFRLSQYWLIFTLFSVPVCLYKLRNQIAQRIEIGFLIVSLSMGVLLIVSIPSGPLISWDDGIHFENTIGVAGFGIKRMTDADDTVIARTFQLDFTPEVIDNQNDKLEQEFRNGTVREVITGVHYNQLGYLPAALGIFLGRLFRCPYHVTFLMGKLFNLFAYVMLAYFSIKKLKSGKVILSIFALFPTCLFLAANYSYDPWVTGWFMLGFSNFVSELQQPNKFLNWKTIVGMIIPFVLGCGPKAIYAPFMLILLIMPKYKFTSDKQRKCFRICVLCGTAMIILSFLTPFVLQINSDAFVGDIRGGSDVDSKKQVMFILKNPITYVFILLKFLIQEYLTLEASSMYMTSFAYLGMTGKHILLVVALAAAVFTDKRKCDTEVVSEKFRICILFAFFITVCAVASALYVSFTPVGEATVYGCQLRYLLPILFPVYFVVGSPHIENHINKSLYNTVLLFVPAYITINAILSLAYSDIKSYMIAGLFFVCLTIFLYGLITKRSRTES